MRTVVIDTQRNVIIAIAIMERNIKYSALTKINFISIKCTVHAYIYSAAMFEYRALFFCRPGVNKKSHGKLYFAKCLRVVFIYTSSCTSFHIVCIIRKASNNTLLIRHHLKFRQF